MSPVPPTIAPAVESCRPVRPAGPWATAVALLGLIASASLLFAADPEVARVVLLPSADRASVVIELDEDVRQTSIHAADDRTVNVEIGPVKSKVVNRLLQATENSLLVSQVRVRGITRGAEGTLIALQIVGKASLSGSVRRVQRRIYVDLEPLSSAAEAVERPAAETRGRRAPATQSAKAAANPAIPRPARLPAASAGVARPPKPSRIAAPQVARGGAPAATPAATKPPSPSLSPSNAVIAKAEALALTPDVKGLERLKTDVQATRPGGGDAATEALMARIDALLTEARKNQLLADAKLFRGSATASAPPPTKPGASSVPAPAATSGQRSSSPAIVPEMAPTPRSSETQKSGGFQLAMRQLRPELERVNGTISVLTPGAVLSGDLPAQIESVLSRLRALDPPGELGSSHERACGALSSLLTGWVRAPNGQWVIAVGSDPGALENTRAAMFDYLRAFDRFDRQSPPLTMLRTHQR